MPSQRPGHIHHDPFSSIAPAQSPGSTGKNDAGDPNSAARLGDTPGTVGQSDAAAILAFADLKHTHGRVERRTHGHALSHITRRQTSGPRPRTHKLNISLWGVVGWPEPPESVSACPARLGLPSQFIDDLRKLYQYSTDRDHFWNKNTLKWDPDHGKQIEWDRRIVLYQGSEIGLYGPCETLWMEDAAAIKEPRVMKKEGNMWVPDTDYKTIGIAHVHPKTSTFSGGDIAKISGDLAEGNDFRIAAVIHETSIHIFLRTKLTEGIGKDQQTWLDMVYARMQELKKVGVSDKKAQDQAVIEAATKNNVALYIYEERLFRRLN
jgi:hypothetical protein